MREIKFRTWLVEQKRMVSAGELQDVRVWDISENSNEIWMQYTGLKGKNGKEIYEGDIVKTPSYPTKYQISEIFFRNGSFGLYLNGTILYESEDPHQRGWIEISQYSYNPESDFEVIGNIYENPELLK